jgi:hypothetical protein
MEVPRTGSLLDQGHVDYLVAPAETEIVLARLALICDLSCPGRLAIRRSALFIGGEAATVPVAHGGPVSAAIERDLDLVMLDDQQRPRPLLPLASPAEVMPWLRSLPGYVSGVGTGRVGRAVSALAHIQQTAWGEFELPPLLWTVIGVEALYSAGEGSIRDRIRRGVATVFGSSETLDRWIGEMYDIRSRLFHGSLDVPMPDAFQYRAVDDVSKHRRMRLDKNVVEPVGRAVTRGAFLLIAGLQSQMATAQGLSFSASRFTYE